MNWETVIQVVIIMVAATACAVLIIGTISASLASKAKRDIELYNAGLMPKGWRAPK